MKANRFTAIDFETANNDRRSACSIGIVTVEDMKITGAVEYLIKPPNSYFKYTYMHGITWNDVKAAPDFSELWPEIKKYFQDIDYVAAYNASFDMGVLKACCKKYRISMPEITYKCALKLARSRLKLKGYSLAEACKFYNIELNHHNALSDSLGCAELMINFMREDFRGGMPFTQKL